MALIKCPECGRENVSDSAEACPNCGFGIKAFYEKEQKREQEEIQRKQLERQLYQKEIQEREKKEAHEKKIHLENEELKKSLIFFSVGLCVFLIICIPLARKQESKRQSESKSYIDSEDLQNSDSIYDEVYVDVTDDDELSEVWWMTKEFITDELKSPTSAKFPVYGDERVNIKKSGHTYKIIGYVNASNSYGAIIENDFSITLEKDGDNYKEIECEFY